MSDPSVVQIAAMQTARHVDIKVSSCLQMMVCKAEGLSLNKVILVTTHIP